MNVSLFIDTLPIMGLGMLGIFVVIGVIYLSVLVMNKVFTPKTEIKPKN